MYVWNVFIWACFTITARFLYHKYYYLSTADQIDIICNFLYFEVTYQEKNQMLFFVVVCLPFDFLYFQYVKISSSFGEMHKFIWLYLCFSANYGNFINCFSVNLYKNNFTHKVKGSNLTFTRINLNASRLFCCTINP